MRQGLVRIALLLGCIGYARAATLPLRVYTITEGLAHNRVNGIYRDSRGFL